MYVNEDQPLFIEEIKADEEFWASVMFPKLENFYKHCILPEIVRGNIPQGKRCVDPNYIVEAQQNIKKRS